jgi:hypothetical protein
MMALSLLDCRLSLIVISPSPGPSVDPPPLTFTCMLHTSSGQSSSLLPPFLPLVWFLCVTSSRRMEKQSYA